MEIYNIYSTKNELERAEAFLGVLEKSFYIEDGYPAVLALIHAGSSIMMSLYPDQSQFILDATNRFFKVLEIVIKKNQNQKEND